MRRRHIVIRLKEAQPDMTVVLVNVARLTDKRAISRATRDLPFCPG